MFTSRAEHRLLLREDNADFRLRDTGYRLGLVAEDVYRQFRRKRDQVEALLTRLGEVQLKPEPWVEDRLKALSSPPINNPLSLQQLLRRPEIQFEHLRPFAPALPEVPPQVAAEVEIMIKYQGYIDRQERQVEKMKRMEAVGLPESLDYAEVHGLTREVREKLGRVRPLSLGQASRISGVTPAALMALQVHLKKLRVGEGAKDG
jgi:tRNA uridine 5-carboxymethylaminomethyl modification enzyme